ncbi:MAG TPA: (2Fe-2S)-binding protein [Candidatus Dormibacteraeota bacterium]|nr:(2Fe-2S)-binding protein [Candidatus Dormibacteraeota bacterium]
MAARSRIRVTVNGSEHDLDARGGITLLDLVRDNLRLTGTKECCDVGECGACTLLVDGRVVNSCLVLATEADGAEVTTIEGLSNDGRLNALQEAFLAKGAVQCGFCIPGQVMAAQYLLEKNPRPTMEQVREGLSGNLCRCGGYVQICEAVLAAAEAGS